MSTLSGSEASTEILSSSSSGLESSTRESDRRKRRRRGRKKVELLRAEDGEQRRRKRFRSSSSSEEEEAVFSSSDLSSAHSPSASSPARGRKRKMEGNEEEVPVRKRRGVEVGVKTKGVQAGRRGGVPAPLVGRRRRPRVTRDNEDSDEDDIINDAEEEDDDEEEEDVSGEESASPARRRRRSVARTPGSPVNMALHRRKRDTAGRTYLHKACGKGNVGEVEQILQQEGTDLIHAEDNAGYLPIHEASLHGHLDVVQVLVKYGSQIDLQSSVDQESPLLDAVENGHLDVVKYLLELGADPRKRDKQGRSCLDSVEENTHENVPDDVREELQEILKAAIKKIAQKPSDDETNRASVPAADSHSSRDPSVTSPVHHSPTAATSTAPRVRRNARAEQSRKDLLWLDSGKGPVVKLREKAREGDVTMVYSLLETGLKPDNATLVGAIKGGHYDMVSMLLAYAAHADPSPGQLESELSRKKREVSMSQCDETPMLAAIGRGNIKILELLLNNGVDARRLDSQGKSYAQISAEREGENWQEEVQILEKAALKAGPRSGGGGSGSGERLSRKEKQSKSPKQQRIRSGLSSSLNAGLSSDPVPSIPAPAVLNSESGKPRQRRDSSTSVRTRNPRSSPRAEKKADRLARNVHDKSVPPPQKQRLRSSSTTSAPPGFDNAIPIPTSAAANNTARHVEPIVEQPPRRSPSSSSRARSRPPAVPVTKPKEDARMLTLPTPAADSTARRSRSAGSFHHLDDTSDPESATEPLGPPKPRGPGVKRADPDTLAPGSPSRRRRRLVSGKERDEEKAMSRNPAPPQPARLRDSDTERRRHLSDKPNKGTKSELDEPPRKLKVEHNEDDVKMDDAPPLDKRKLKQDRERERQSSVRSTDMRDPKRPPSNRERSKSPRRNPKPVTSEKHDPETFRKRRRDDSLDNRSERRRDSVVGLDRRPRDGSRPTGEKLRRGSQSVEAPRKQEVPRGVPREPSGHHPEDDRVRRKEREAEKAPKIKEKPEDMDARKPSADRPRTQPPQPRINQKLTDIKAVEKPELKSRIEDDATLEAEAKELLRRKHLIRELNSIQQKARIESQKAQQSEVITRGLAERRIREEEDRKERIRREKQEREEEQRHTVEDASRQQEAVQRAEQEKVERANREKELADREARERAEKEALEAATRVRTEQQQLADLAAAAAEEKRAAEAAEAERLRLVEETEAQRQEAERKRKAELEAETVRTAEEDRKRREVESEKAAQDLRDRHRIAEQLQAQLAAEDATRKRAEADQHRSFIASLPHALRVIAEDELNGIPPVAKPKTLPWFVGRIPTSSSQSPINGVAKEKQPPLWATNIQASLALGITDLNFPAYPDLVRRPASDFDRTKIWNCMNPLLCSEIRTSNSSMAERNKILEQEREKFLKLKPVFWIKLDSLTRLIDTHPSLRERGHTTIEISLTPTTATSSTSSPTPPPKRPLSKEQMATAKARARNNNEPTDPLT